MATNETNETNETNKTPQFGFRSNCVKSVFLNHFSSWLSASHSPMIKLTNYAGLCPLCRLPINFPVCVQWIDGSFQFSMLHQNAPLRLKGRALFVISNFGVLLFEFQRSTFALKVCSAESVLQTLLKKDFEVSLPATSKLEDLIALSNREIWNLFKIFWNNLN